MWEYSQWTACKQAKELFADIIWQIYWIICYELFTQLYYLPSSGIKAIETWALLLTIIIMNYN